MKKMTAINEVFDKCQGNPGSQGIGFIAGLKSGRDSLSLPAVMGSIYTLSETERVTNYFKETAEHKVDVNKNGFSMALPA